MARDLKDFYAAQRRLEEAAQAEWAALGGGLAPFALAADDDVAAWADALVAAGDAGLACAGASRSAGRGTADLAARGGRDRAYAAPALLQVAMRDGVLVAPVPGELRTAFAHRHPERESETAVGYGFEPAAARVLTLQARHAVAFAALETPPGTPGAQVAAHVLRVVTASLDGWRPAARQASA